MARVLAQGQISSLARGPRFRCVLLISCALVALLCQNTSASASDREISPMRDTYGEVGILDMPSARMAPDGEISVTIGTLTGTQRVNFAFEVLPWLEGSFRYSHISNFGAAKKNDFDRSFGLKARLWQEDDWLPEFSIGIRDLIGTGIYGGEYLVASKQLFSSLD